MGKGCYLSLSLNSVRRKGKSGGRGGENFEGRLRMYVCVSRYVCKVDGVGIGMMGRGR